LHALKKVFFGICTKAGAVIGKKAERFMLGHTMTKRQRAWGELALIEQIRTKWGPDAGASRSHSRVRLGIGDDCAILRPPRGHEVLVTTDFSLEGRHFRRDWHTPESVGHRCLARGLSDLAAMGAVPLAAFLSLALPREVMSTASGRRWVKGFFAGLRRLAEQCNVPLAGGDTAQAPGEFVLADIVLVGSAPVGRALRRSSAHAGDLLYVTGALGGAAAELEAIQRSHDGQSSQNTGPILRSSMRNTGSPILRSSIANGGWPILRSSIAKGGLPSSTPATQPHTFPEPRIAVGLSLLRRRLATAAIDLSDGLSTDLTHLCKESGLAAEIDTAALPIHPLAALDSNHALQLALSGGEDYELLFAAPANVQVPRRIAGVPITQIGRLLRPRPAAATITLISPDGRRKPLTPSGWEHFS
jgi:thiamine-monophosphate kinase